MMLKTLWSYTEAFQIFEQLIDNKSQESEHEDNILMKYMTKIEDFMQEKNIQN